MSKQKSNIELNVVLNELMSELIDEVTLGVCFEVHRSCKIGTFFLDDTDEISEKKFHISEQRGLDVFGAVPMKKQLECMCPNCSRNLAASRFAPHLEKCMGMGRNSSRIASRRIANTGAKKDSPSDNEEEDDNDNDSEWNFIVDKKIKKTKKEKMANSPRRNKSQKLSKNGDIPSVGSNTSEGSSSQQQPYETMTLEEKKTLLMQTCGVISEHTKKMCTRSHRCPQHTDEQRVAVRHQLLGQPGSSIDTDDVHIDIDTYDDSDTQALRDTLQWEAISNPSPADSTSTTNSNSSKKRKHSKQSGSKKKSSSKSASNTRSETPTSVLYEFL